MIEYPFTIHKLSSEEGGGYMAEALDLNGCIADGETIDEAVINLEDAITSWIRTAQEFGDPIPIPSDDSKFRGVNVPNLKTRQTFEATDQGIGLTSGKPVDEFFEKLIAQKD